MLDFNIRKVIRFLFAVPKGVALYCSTDLGMVRRLVRIAEGLGINMWEWRNREGVGLKHVVKGLKSYCNDGVDFDASVNNLTYPLYL